MRYSSASDLGASALARSRVFAADHGLAGSRHPAFACRISASDCFGRHSERFARHFALMRGVKSSGRGSRQLFVYDAKAHPACGGTGRGYSIGSVRRCGSWRCVSCSSAKSSRRGVFSLSAATRAVRISRGLRQRFAPAWGDGAPAPLKFPCAAFNAAGRAVLCPRCQDRSGVTYIIL